MKRKKSLLKNALIASFLLTTTLLSFAQARTTRVRGGTAYSEEKQNTATQTAQMEKKPVSQTAQAEKQKTTKKNSSEIKLSLQRIEKIKSCIDNYSNSDLGNNETINKIKNEIAQFVPLVPTKKLKKDDLTSLQDEARKMVEKEYGSASDIAKKIEEKAKVRYPLSKVGDRIELEYYVGSRHYSVKGKLVRITQRSITVDDKMVNLMDLDEENISKFDSKTNQAFRSRYIKNQTSIENQNKTEKEKEYLKQLRTAFVHQNEDAGYIYDSNKSVWCTAKEIADNYIEAAIKRKEQEQKRKKEEQERIYEEGMVAYQQKQYKTAVDKFANAIDKGVAKAYYRLGVCYACGNGVSVNPKEADSHFKKAISLINASEDNDPEQQFIIAECYFYGYGVEQDFEKASDLYKKTAWGEEKNDKLFMCDLFAKAKNGESDAQFEVGTYFYKGKNVDRSLSEAVKWYRKAAEQGYSKALYKLGECYEDGMGVDKDTNEALKWYREAAKQDDCDALFKIGEYYCEGKAGDKDYNEGVKWYKKALEQGSIHAQYELGMCFYWGRGVEQDRVKAFELFRDAADKWRKAADQGDAEAQFRLGVCYTNRWGVVDNESEEDFFSIPADQLPSAIESFKWYRKAAEQGHIKAQTSLGMCYDSGSGVKKNTLEALNWYQKAAEQGAEDAQMILGNKYATGLGVRQNYNEAIKWFLEVAKHNNDADLQVRIAECYAKTSKQSEAIKWYRKAAEHGHVQAQYLLGIYYTHAILVKEDFVEAAKWFRKAAEQGHAEAQSNLAFCYKNGRGVEQNAAEAVKWFRKAAEQGIDVAQCELALCYLNGRGVKKDSAEALKWIHKAAEQGNPDAQYALGMYYAEGIGIKKDQKEGVKWLRKAAAQGYEEAIDALKLLGY